MAVITELIDAGLRLKRGGNLGGAIEHFRQLRRTYPDNARIMFELAACWRAFGVPERALPLYRELLAAPSGKGLPPKDMPRLYTQLGATLLEMGEEAEALAIIEAGLRLHPSYRSLRAWRIFALAKAGRQATALVDALELMLESLAPSRWDIFEADVKAMVRAMRDDLPALAALAEAQPDEARPAALIDPEPAAKGERVVDSGADAVSGSGKIEVESDIPDAAETAVAVNLVKPKKKTNRKKSPGAQMGRKAVRIDISSDADAPAPPPDDDEAAPADGRLKIPIDLD